MDNYPLPAVEPAQAGFDPSRLAQIGAAMQTFVDSKKVPNLVTLLARHGKVVHFEARGVLDLDEPAEVQKNTLFRMYSNTKPIAGVATMILFERGVLTPDDPVSKFLPEYANQRVMNRNEPMVTAPTNRGITIRDCLTNTTGLHNPGTMPSFYRQQFAEQLDVIMGPRDEEGERQRVSNRERVRALASLPLAWQPGERFGYHVGYPVLTAVLEEASGQSLDVFLRENVFEPLGMSDTDYYVREGAIGQFGACYAPREVDGKIKLVVTEKAATSEKVLGPKTEFSAGGDMGGVLSTAGDYARFGQMLLNGGALDGTRILGRKTVDMMIGNHTGSMTIPMTGRGFHWGLGVAMYHGRDIPPLIRSVGTYGWGGAAGTTYFADPAEGMLGVCLTQVLNHGMMPDNNYQETFQRLAYQALV